MAERCVLLEQGHQRLIRARHGYVLYNKNDTVIGRLIEVYGEFFEAEVEIFRRFVSPGDVVLDVGANIGPHTLALARLVGPGGLVFAFEPQRIVFQTLCANISLNSIDNVLCVNAALGETPGRLTLRDPDPTIPNNYGGVELSMLASPAGGFAVERLVLDDFLHVGRLKLIKIDVEGMEASVLRGARKTLEKFKPFMYVENDRVENSQELLSVLWDAGFNCFWHLPPYVTDNNYFDERQRAFPIAFLDQGGTYLSGVGFAVNLLCVHASLNLPIEDLRPAVELMEHPYKRDYVHRFSVNDHTGIPIVKA